MQRLLTADDEGTPQLRNGHTAAGVTNASMQRQTEINSHEEGTNHRMTNNFFSDNVIKSDGKEDLRLHTFLF